MSDETTTSERVGFCQDCGKPLSKDEARTVGQGVFCEPCLHTRLTSSAKSAVPPPAAAGYTAPAVPPSYAGSNPPHPWLAGTLSIIPGVGQVYNGQYAKGIAILLICAVLDSLGKNSHFGVFGVAAFGLYIYQIVDAYQTAKALVEGRPLPNPFDLNDIGEKLGFGKGFGTSAQTRAAAYGTGAYATTPVPPTPGTSPETAAAQAAQTAPSTPWMPVNQNPVPAPTANWTGYVPPVAAPYVAPAPPPPPYSAPYSAAPMSNVPMPGSSFPLIAIWLILLGVLFALGEWVPVWHINGSIVTAIVLGAIAASIFVRRLGYMGGLSYQGPMLHMMRLPMVLTVLAVLFLLQGVHAATIGQTWPVILLALGAVMLGERLGVGTQPYPQSYPTQPQNAARVSVVPPAPAATSEAATTSATTTEEQHSDERDGYSR